MRRIFCETRLLQKLADGPRARCTSRFSTLLLLLVTAASLSGCEDALGIGGSRIVISGAVRMAADRSPVQDARIVATTNRTGEWSQLQRVAAFTGADGSYSMRIDCPRGAQISIFMGYESGRSVLGERGRDDLVIHAAELDGQPLPSGMLEQRGVDCTTSRTWAVDFLVRAQTRGPSVVAGGHSFTHLAAGSETVCGVTREGAAYCWGNGALGDGRYRRYDLPGSLPVRVSGEHAFTTLAVGSDLACGITTEAEAMCWGGYHTNAAGDGSLAGTPRLAPVRVAGGHRFQTIATGGDHACALNVVGEAYCWGANSLGQLGTGSPGPPSPRPVPVVGGLNFASIAAGREHTCALTFEGRAYCWGHGPALGANRTQPSFVPIPVSGEYRFRMLSSGVAHTCGIATDGAAFCWGWNLAGQLGVGGTSIGAAVPVRVASDRPFASVSAGEEHTCAVGTDQRLYCWGSNSSAQIAAPASTGSPVPVVAAGESRFSAAAAGRGGAWGAFTCGLEPAGRVLCWGANTSVLGSPP
jgi:alpha-tubulin suppressor-like RCC1 family protein